MADAAKAAGVGHFVYASAPVDGRGPGLASLESKWAIEQHIASLGLSATILRSAAFMENYVTSSPGEPPGPRGSRARSR